MALYRWHQTFHSLTSGSSDRPIAYMAAKNLPLSDVGVWWSGYGRWTVFTGPPHSIDFSITIQRSWVRPSSRDTSFSFSSKIVLKVEYNGCIWFLFDTHCRFRQILKYNKYWNFFRLQNECTRLYQIDSSVPCLNFQLFIFNFSVVFQFLAESSVTDSSSVKCRIQCRINERQM